MYAKGDWAEYALSLGFPTWAQHANPCPKCHASGGPSGSWGDVASLSPVSTPWKAKTLEEYFDACAEHEIVVLVSSRRDLLRLCSNMEFGLAHSGGRYVTGGPFVVGGVELRDGDRLEPNMEVPDIGAVETCLFLIVVCDSPSGDSPRLSRPTIGTLSFPFGRI